MIYHVSRDIFDSISIYYINDLIPIPAQNNQKGNGKNIGYFLSNLFHMLCILRFCNGLFNFKRLIFGYYVYNSIIANEHVSMTCMERIAKKKKNNDDNNNHITCNYFRSKDYIPS